MFLSLLQVAGTTSVAAMAECKVDCSHYGTTPGDLADDPTDCHKYYICFSTTDWSVYSFNCPAGENFDTITKQCKVPTSPFFSCSPPCEKCTYDCLTNILGKAANQYDCSVYFLCDPVMGSAIATEICPAEAPYFDGNKCQTNKGNCCTCRPSCTATDVTTHTRVPDYHNCTNYYLCISEGFQDQTAHGHCPTGNFEPMSGSCIVGTPCVLYPLCNS